MTKHELAKAISNEMFAERETLKEAFDYALEVARASDNFSAVITAVMVLANTISIEIKKLEADRS